MPLAVSLARFQLVVLSYSIHYLESFGVEPLVQLLGSDALALSLGITSVTMNHEGLDDSH